MKKRSHNISYIRDYIIFLAFCFLAGCSGLEQSQQEEIRRQNAKGEFIYRRHNETLFTVSNPKLRVRDKYPWEDSYIGNLPRITKEYFRCRGSHLNPAKTQEKEGQPLQIYNDCGGSDRHSLPLKNNKEFIYPILVDLLNYVQMKTGKKVVITCGHRCPAHNTYADLSVFNQTSKHMIGAEVDFYVQGLENKPEEIVALLQQFYQDSAVYKEKKDYQFLRYEKGDSNVSTKPWYNKEIFIKLFKEKEGRDFDNRHAYPYICIQVRFDAELNEKVIYNWPKANNEYKRH